jgi:hypothetical protein
MDWARVTVAADDLLRRLERGPIADLSAAFQVATLEGGLRALFSMPDSIQRARLGAMVRGYVEGSGHPNILDMLARDESAFDDGTAATREPMLPSPSTPSTCPARFAPTETCQPPALTERVSAATCFYAARTVSFPLRVSSASGWMPHS